MYVSGITEYMPKTNRLGYIVHHKTYLNDGNMNNDNITLDWNNLELLCIDCHNEEHTEQPTRKGLMFDEMGNLVEKTKIGRLGGSEKTNF